MTARLLLVEDDPEARASVALLLELEGFTVAAAADGEAGLALLAEGPPPDLVLCDLMLPGIDGFAVLDAVRAEPRLAGLPFVFLTARADRESLRRGMTLGADDFLTKPFTGEELLATIGARLRRRPAGPAPLDPEAQRRLDRLSPRERQVLEALAQGRSGPEISRALGISPRTEQVHRARLMLKLDLHTASALAAFAVRAGLGRTPDTSQHDK